MSGSVRSGAAVRPLQFQDQPRQARLPCEGRAEALRRLLPDLRALVWPAQNVLHQAVDFPVTWGEVASSDEFVFRLV